MCRRWKNFTDQAIYLENRLLPNLFTAERISVLNLLSHQIAVCLENALLINEKDDILRYLHDSISADMLNILYMSELSNRESSPEELKAALADIGEASANSIATIRSFMSFANADSLTLEEFSGMLSDCAFRIFQHSAIAFQLLEPASIEMTITPFAAFQMHLIFKEAITNIRKHAGASQVILTLDSRPERLELTISDDGSGFDTGFISKSGYGLHNMRARSEKLGAQFDINSKPGNGTEIVLRLPLREK